MAGYQYLNAYGINQLLSVNSILKQIDLFLPIFNIFNIFPLIKSFRKRKDVTKTQHAFFLLKKA